MHNSPENMFASVATNTQIEVVVEVGLKERGEARTRKSFEMRVSNETVLGGFLMARNHVFFEFVSPS